VNTRWPPPFRPPVWVSGSKRGISDLPFSSGRFNLTTTPFSLPKNSFFSNDQRYAPGDHGEVFIEIFFFSVRVAWRSEGDSESSS